MQHCIELFQVYYKSFHCLAGHIWCPHNPNEVWQKTYKELINFFWIEYYSIFRPQAVTGRVLWIRTLPATSVFPSFHPEVYFVLAHQFFQKLSMVLKAHVLLCVTRSDFFAPKMGKMGQKLSFLNLLENLVINFFWIWSIKKVCICAVVLHKSHIWEKSGSCRLRHMKNKGVRQSHASSQNSEAIDVWKVARHPSSRCVVACDDYSF